MKGTITMGKTYTITEYGSFSRGIDAQGCVRLPEDTFDALEQFVLSNNNKSTDALDLMGVSARKGVGHIITAKNFVGVISMKDGTTIEIYPKIYSKTADNGKEDTRVKKLLVDMLKTLRNSPFKSLQTANVNIEKMRVFEIFIRMYIDEVFFIVKRGLKSNYETIESNESVFKGKLRVSEQLRHNYAHKEKSFVEYDEFNINRVENKILKATLQYLYGCSVSMKNKNDIKTLLNYFVEVESSVDYSVDFAKIVPERNTKDYETALLWSRVFLMGKSFTSFSGSEVAFALLFPMETLFESYVAAQLKKLLKGTEYKLSAQDKTYHLFEEPGKKFQLRPDIVIRNHSEIVIMDTKWKVLSDRKANYGISQADMYQMYAYQKKYGASSVTLLYPLTDKVAGRHIEYKSEDGVTVRVRFVDLYDVNAFEGIVIENGFIH